tara:strand:- start:45 stop:413 length:369 start_codon:yes stop_codon:yes gene_type:complete
MKQSEEMKKVLARLDEAKAPVGGSACSISVDLKVTLIEGVDTSNLPKQVQLIANYLTALGGTATVRDINELGQHASGSQIWGRADGTPYEQSPQRVLAHYFNKCNGSVAWTPSKGIKAIITS